MTRATNQTHHTTTVPAHHPGRTLINHTPNGRTRSVVIGSVAGVAVLALGTFISQASGVAASGATHPLTSASRVTPNGAGAVRIGMTVRQAERVTGQRFVGLSGRPAPVNGGACFYVRARGGPVGLSFMLHATRVARLDVAAPNRSTATTRAVRRGASEAAVMRAYPGRISVSPRKYVPGGHNLTYAPASASLARYRIVFQTDGHKVVAIIAGRLPEVNLVEGCG